MNIENLISRYLAIYKSVSFEEIGTLSTMSYAETPADNEHTNTDNIFQFEFNLKEKADQGLITYAVEQTGKLRSLIASDIQSFTFTGKQFLNIGKPFLIKDIGYFQKNNDNEYLFFKGNPIAEAINTNHKRASTHASINNEIDFSSPLKVKPTKKWIKISLIILFMSIPIAGIVFMYNNQKEKNTPIINVDSSNSNIKQILHDSAAPSIPINDTSVKKLSTDSILSIKDTNQTFMKKKDISHVIKTNFHKKKTKFTFIKKDTSN